MPKNATGAGSANSPVIDMSYSEAVSNRSARDEADAVVKSAKASVARAKEQLKAQEAELAKAVRQRKELD